MIDVKTLDVFEALNIFFILACHNEKSKNVECYKIKTVIDNQKSNAILLSFNLSIF